MGLTPSARERGIVERTLRDEPSDTPPTLMSRLTTENEARRLILADPNSSPAMLRASLQSAYDDICRLTLQVGFLEANLKSVAEVVT